MNEFIWRPKTINEPYEKSRIEDKPANYSADHLIEQKEQKEQKEETVEQRKEIVDPNTFYDNNGVFRMSSSKREEVNLKMHEREPISQRNQNPYLVQNNYLDDLEMQQSFLIPKNSNFNDKK